MFHAGTLLTTTGVGLSPPSVSPVMVVELTAARPLSVMLQEEESVRYNSSGRLPRTDGMARQAVIQAAHAACTCRWKPPSPARRK